MKKKILLILAIMAVLCCIFAITAFAEDKIIKLESCPTLAEIHANPDKYISHLDDFDGDSLGAIDSESVVVLCDSNSASVAPTYYYVFPSYYYMRSTSNAVWGNLTKLNDAIAKADPTAFASYEGIGGGWSGGGCKYLVRYEVPTYVTSFSGTTKFENDVNLIEIYFPTHIVTDEETGEQKEVAYVTSVSGQNLFSGCGKLEYIHNSDKLPPSIITGNNDGLASCSSLKEIKFPEGVTSVPGGCFSGCSSLTEIVMPNSVTALGKKAFAGCSKLETVRFGANFTTFSSPNVDYETFSGCSKLKYVYLPSTFDNSVTATNNNFKNIFSSGSKVTFFLAGSYADAERSKGKFAATNANAVYGGATIVEYNPNIDYKGYADTLGYSIIVYNYSPCTAFYDGEHEAGGTTCNRCGETLYCTDTNHNLLINIVYASYTEDGTKTTKCLDCNTAEVVNQVAPLFICQGYSAPQYEADGISFAYAVNNDAIAEYTTVTGKTLAYGVFAVLDTRVADGYVFDESGEKIEGSICEEISGCGLDAFEMKISGFKTDEQKNLKIAMGAYVVTAKDDVTEYKYIQVDAPEEGAKYSFVSYNDIVAGQI